MQWRAYLKGIPHCILPLLHLALVFLQALTRHTHQINRPLDMATELPSLEELLTSVSKKTLEKPCSDEHIVEIAREITNWRLIAPDLGLTAVDEEDIRQNHRDDVPIQRREMLRTWKQKFGSKATYGSLAKAFYKTKRVDLVEKVIALLTEEAARSPAPLRFLQCPPEMSVQVTKSGMQVVKKCADGRLGVTGRFGIALTNRPLRTAEMFQIEILYHALISNPPIGMAFGITTHEVMDFPPHMRELTTGTWMLDWDRYSHHKQEEHVVLVNGKGVKQDFVSGDDLRALKTATYPQEGELSLRALLFASILVKTVRGDRVALRVTEKRELVFYINGEEKGVVATDIPEGVYGFVELPRESAVELVPDNIQSVLAQ